MRCIGWGPGWAGRRRKHLGNGFRACMKVRMNSGPLKTGTAAGELQAHDESRRRRAKNPIKIE